MEALHITKWVGPIVIYRPSGWAEPPSAPQVLVSPLVIGENLDKVRPCPPCLVTARAGGGRGGSPILIPEGAWVGAYQ